jgi:ADP-ribosylglycohydrolase
MTKADRALASLQGLAIGDALGMPTQMMSREAIMTRFGEITRFEAAAADHPLAAGMPAGSITDDTEQALLLARLIIDGGGHVDPAGFARELVRWEDGMRQRGSLDLLGPSTKRAVEALLDGESADRAGRFGTTNGAAMRVTPVGIASASTDLPALVELVVECSSVTHNTGIALAGAAAVAAAVSAGIDGAQLAAAVELALEAAELAATRGYWVAGADVARRIRWAIDLVDPVQVERGLDDIYQLVGTSLATQESVPAAFALLALFPDEPWTAMTAAASLGGDSDTTAAMVGAIGGAVYGPFAATAIQTVTEVNHLDLQPLVEGLLELR